MTCLMLAATLALGFGPQQPSGPVGGGQPGAAAGQQGALTQSPMDGTWTILCAELNGQKLNTGSHGTVTIRNNILTFQKDGKEHRVHLQFGANHMVSVRPENTEKGAGAQGQTGERGQQQPGAREGQGQRPGQTGKEGEKSGKATPQGTDEKSGEQAQGTQVPAQGRPQIPAHIPGQPDYRIYQGATQQAGQAAHLPQGAGPGAHQGVYIFADDFLCLAFDHGMMMGGTQHQANAPAGSSASGTLGAGQRATTGQQTAAPGHPQGTTQQAAAPGQQQGTNPQGANKQGTNQQAANPQRTQPGGTPQATPGAGQTASANQGTGGQTRTANYPNSTPQAGAAGHQGGFVLILRREGGQQNQGQRP